MKRVQGIIFAIVSAITFGFVPVFAKIAYAGGTNAITTVFLRFLLAALMLLVYFVVRGIDFRLGKKALGKIIFLSIFGYAATSITLFLSYQYIAIGLATVLHFVYPAVVVFMAFIIFREKLHISKIICLLLSIVGIYTLIGFGGDSFSPMGAALAVASGVFYSIYILGIGHGEVKGIDTFVLVFYVSGFASLATLAFGACTGKLDFSMGIQSLLAVFGLALLCTIGAFVTFVYSVKYIGSSNAAILSTFEPITGIVLGMLFFGDKMTIPIAVGSIFILISVIIMCMGERRENKEEGHNVKI